MRSITPKRLRGLLSWLWFWHPFQHTAVCMIVCGRYTPHTLATVWEPGRRYWKDEAHCTRDLSACIKHSRFTVVQLIAAADDPDMREVAAESLTDN